MNCPDFRLGPIDRDARPDTEPATPRSVERSYRSPRAGRRVPSSKRMTVVSMCHMSSARVVRRPTFGLAGCTRSRGRRSRAAVRGGTTVVGMEMIIGRSLTPLIASRTMGASAGVATTRAGKCRMSAGIARQYGLLPRSVCNDKGEWLYEAPGPNAPIKMQGRRLSDRRPGHVLPDQANKVQYEA
jgi:hypothetical protein